MSTRRVLFLGLGESAQRELQRGCVHRRRMERTAAVISIVHMVMARRAIIAWRGGRRQENHEGAKMGLEVKVVCQRGGTKFMRSMCMAIVPRECACEAWEG